jgi:hypothetical protein
MGISVESEVHLERFIELQTAIHDGLIEGLEQAGKHIVDLASQLAPKDSGDLSESGDSFVEDTTLVVSFGNGLPDERALAQEFGTIYFPAQPYLYPAIANIDIVEEVAKAVRSKLL